MPFSPDGEAFQGADLDFHLALAAIEARDGDLAPRRIRAHVERFYGRDRARGTA
jgi:DNA-binding FadR family transcriptional regulator